MLKKLICAILRICPRCKKPLDAIIDYSGGVKGYGLYYCKECSKM
jgi:hypothetical protein